jgi:hypothetical protein
MNTSAGHALVLLTLFAGSAALAQTAPWPTDPPPARQQAAPWPGNAPPPQQQATPFPSNPPQQQAAPWPGNAPPGQPAAMSAPPPMMGAGGPPPGGPPGQPPPCVTQFLGHRDKVEKAAGLAKTASERHATREEMCKLVTAYFNAEVQWIKFAKDNVAKCSIPAEVTKQIEGVHVRTGNIRKQICAAGPTAGGPAAPSLSDALGTTNLPVPEAP